MTRIIAFVLFFLSSPTWAGVPCTLPFNLQNGTTADASQVMANYNALVTCLSTAAAAGANSDITSLNGLTTPIPHTAGGTAVYTGGFSSGSANAQTVTSTTPTFILQVGTILTFVSSFNNTGATTLNVQGTGIKNIFRLSQLGISNLVGGELRAGQQIILLYDGTEFECMSCGQYVVGQVMDYAGSTIPLGWLAVDGSCQAQSNYMDLYSVIGTGYGACGAGQFALPDGRGRVLAGFDNQGTNGNANRMTSCGSNQTTLGGVCGQQNETVLQANLPSVNFTVSGITINTVNVPTQLGTNFQTGGAGSASLVPGNGSAPTTLSPTINSQGTAASGGSGTALPTVQPTGFIYKIIKL